MMEARDFIDDPGYSILPTDPVAVTPEERLDNAVAAALEDVYGAEEAPPVPVPYGRSWRFNREAGRFVRSGAAPLEVRGEESLIEWILNALWTAAGHHPILPDSFGIEDPSAIIGEADPTMQMADWRREVEQALLVHDRIQSIDEIELEWDPSAGVVYLTRMEITTDDDQAVAVLDVPVVPEV